jgi:RNA polymerase sigma-54 factor
MLRQTQGQRLQQKADPQLLLTNRILQMSSMELQQRIIQEIAENPALEQAEEYPCNRCDIPGPQCAECPYYHAQFGGQNNAERDDLRGLSYDAIGGKDEDMDPIALIEDKPTLQDHLLMQLRSIVSRVDYRIGEYLITNIDADGYLQCTTSEAAADLEVREAEVETALQVIQTMDPSGVGARSLQECLLIQVQALGAEGKLPPFVNAILRNYWKELSANKIRAIARGLRSTPEAIQAAVDFIRQNLSPYPGSSFRPPWDKHSHRSAQAIRPDVVIHVNAEGEFEIQIVEGDQQIVHLNPKYARMWSEMRERPHEYSEAERRHVQDYVNRAQMFLKSLDDRKQILYQVAECVLDEQHPFFKTEREEDLTALTQTKVAALLRVHESTVSRTVAEKFMQLPSGQVVNLGFFFDRSANLRALVQNVLATENPQAPYSDQEISDILRGQGIVIARRTVMKYREEMNILSSRQRARA